MRSRLAPVLALLLMAALPLPASASTVTDGTGSVNTGHYAWADYGNVIVPTLTVASGQSLTVTAVVTASSGAYFLALHCPGTGTDILASSLTGNGSGSWTWVWATPGEVGSDCTVYASAGTLDIGSGTWWLTHEVADPTASPSASPTAEPSAGPWPSGPLPVVLVGFAADGESWAGTVGLLLLTATVLLGFFGAGVLVATAARRH